jgi:ATP-dependent RNA helicase DDX42
MVLPNFHAKQAWLQEMLPILSTVGLTLVFVATRIDCEALATKLQEKDPSLQLATLHGDKHATDRKSALRAFGKADNPIKTLICTDVASRGLDMHVATVVSFDPAKNLDIHVHRIGRAGRLAKKEGGYRQGTAYTLLLGKKNADFAHVLMQSFEREGREISPELRQLAQQSRRKSGTTESREKWNKAGLGFDGGDKSRYGPASSRAEDLAKASPAAGGGGSYYGPSATSSSSPQSRDLDSASIPPAKKSRWG